ncbi:MAG: nucleoside monophosphate kinase [Candidatus Pacebacteria bacterium]|nr:nucleoside monophosphate kinase [Candidatus Paceibacterota bacterium]
MDLKTAILIGPSGCGKGTQAKLLKEYLETHDTEHPTHYFQTGDKFREFMEGDKYTQHKIKEVLSNGGLAPGFLPIWIWGSLFIEGVTGDDHIVTDGFPRRAEESPILHTAFEFYERKDPVVISFEMPDDVIVERLVNGRKRFDDTPEKVAERLKWFRRDVSLAIKFFEEHPYYTVAHIKGDQTVEEVHRDVLQALSLA